MQQETKMHQETKKIAVDRTEVRCIREAAAEMTADAGGFFNRCGVSPPRSETETLMDFGYAIMLGAEQVEVGTVDRHDRWHHQLLYDIEYREGRNGRVYRD